MVLQTFLLLDLWSKDNDLEGVTLISIKSAPKIYYIQISILKFKSAISKYWYQYWYWNLPHIYIATNIDIEKNMNIDIGIDIDIGEIKSIFADFYGIFTHCGINHF